MLPLEVGKETYAGLQQGALCNFPFVSPRSPSTACVHHKADQRVHTPGLKQRGPRADTTSPNQQLLQAYHFHEKQQVLLHKTQIYSLGLSS